MERTRIKRVNGQLYGKENNYRMLVENMMVLNSKILLNTQKKEKRQGNGRNCFIILESRYNFITIISQAQVYEVGEYMNSQKSGTWKYIYND